MLATLYLSHTSQNLLPGKERKHTKDTCTRNRRKEDLKNQEGINCHGGSYNWQKISLIFWMNWEILNY